MTTLMLMRAAGSVRRMAAPATCLAVLCLVVFPFLHGCHQIAQPEPPSGPAQSLTVFTYPNYLPDDVLQGFEKTTGITVHYRTFETVTEMRHLVVSNPGAYDVLIADGGRTATEYRHLKLIQPFQTRKISGLHQLDPRFGVFNLETPEILSIPFLWGSTIAAYRTDLLPLRDEEKKWALFWDERVRGKTSLIEEPVDIFAAGLAALGLPIHSQNVADNERAEAHLRKAIEENGTRLGDCWANLDRLVSGESWLVQCYSGDAAMCAKEHPNIGFFLPKEGAQLWVDGFLLCADSTRVEAAHRFVSYMLRPDVAARCADSCLQLTPNRSAQPLIDPKVLANEVINPPAEVLDHCSLTPALDTREWAGMLQLGLRHLQQAADSTAAREAASSPASAPQTVTASVLEAGDPP